MSKEKKEKFNLPPGFSEDDLIPIPINEIEKITQGIENYLNNPNQVESDDNMPNTIESAFGVRHLSQNEGASLFYKFKESILHFVLCEHNNVYECHIPRFEYAVGFEYLIEKDEVSPDEYFLYDNITLEKRNAGFFNFNFLDWTFELSEQEHKVFFKAVKADIRSYKKAFETLDKNTGDEPIAKLKTLSGKPIIAKQEYFQLLCIILFEQSLPKKKKPITSLSIYALYSRLLDEDFHITDEEFMRIADSFTNLPGPTGEPLDIQQMIFASIFWSLDWASNPNEICELLKEKYHEFDLIQKLIFHALYNEHKSSVLLTLGYIKGLITMNDWIKYSGQGLRPGSDEHQQLRMNINVVHFFLKYGGIRDHRYLGYLVEIPADDRNGAKSFFFRDISFLRARELAVQKIKNFQKEYDRYKGVALGLVLLNRMYSDEPQPCVLEVLTGKRMHNLDILKSLDLEARSLEVLCGFTFPIMITTFEGEDYASFNSYFQTLYYFTA